MFFTKTFRHAVFTVSALATLAACGGGGAGEGDAPPPTPTLHDIAADPAAQQQRANLSLTSDNFDLVAYLVLFAAKTTSDLEEMAAVFSLGVAEFNLSAQQEFGESPTSECEGGGTMTVDINDKDGDGTLSRGDDYQVSNEGCTSGNGVVSSGTTLVHIVDRVDGVDETDPTLLELHRVYSGVTSSAALGSIRVERESRMTIRDKRDSSGDSVRTLVLEVPRSASDNGVVAETITDYRSTLALTTTASAPREYDTTFVLEASGTIGDSRLGRYTIATPVAVEGYHLGLPGFPDRFFAGTLEAVFDDGRRVRITALDETDAEIEADLDTDGRYELNRRASWEDLSFAYSEWIQGR